VQGAPSALLFAALGNAGAMSAAESFEVEHGGATGAVTPVAAARAAAPREATGVGMDAGGGGGGGGGAASAAGGGEAARGPRPAGPARSVCQSYLSGGKIYSCCHCRAHLASHDEIISKSFQGHHGRAYLFNNLCVRSPPPARARLQPATPADHTASGLGPRVTRRINVSEGPTEERTLITGIHTVCDIYCNVCQAVLGWKYVSRQPTHPLPSCRKLLLWRGWAAHGGRAMRTAAGRGV
jgi:hypothetical protein